MPLLSVRCKIQPAASQVESLSRTVDAFTAACNYVLRVARETDTFNKFVLQKATYRDVRAEFGLSANLAIQAIQRVGKRKGKRTGGFKATSVSYDQRILSLKDEVLSLTTVDGRLRMPLAIGNYQRHLLRTALSIQGGQLVRGQKGKWYIHLQCKFADETPQEPTGSLGVDLGIAQIATTSDGETFTGAEVENKRQKFQQHRSSLQKCGARSAKRRLKKVAGREARFRRDTNHKIAKHLVETAKRTGRELKLEDLSGIRDRVRLKKSQRAKHHGWSFYQLREFVAYRAVRVAPPLGLVDARNTSRTCSTCGSLETKDEKANRKSQAEFKCCLCGYSANADLNAAKNIARADVLQPIVSWIESKSVHTAPQKQANVL
jgi:IS605 OrfB family transposase